MHLCVCVGGQICQLIQGRSAKFSCQLSVAGRYICWQIQGRSAKFKPIDVSTGGTSAGRSRVDLPNLATRCQYWGVHLLADLGQICQIWSPDVSMQGVHLPWQMLGQICKIWLLGVSTGGTSAGRSRVDLSNLICQICTRGTSASRSRVDLHKFWQDVFLEVSWQSGDDYHLDTRGRYRGLHLPADLGQICQILQMSVQGVHLLADLGQICQIYCQLSGGCYICWQIYRLHNLANMSVTASVACRVRSAKVRHLDFSTMSTCASR